jgi:hypothetical protein
MGKSGALAGFYRLIISASTGEPARENLTIGSSVFFILYIEDFDISPLRPARQDSSPRYDIKV